jgi:hypothetical protein
MIFMGCNQEDKNGEQRGGGDHRRQHGFQSSITHEGRCGFSRSVDHHNAPDPRPRGALPCSRAAAGLCTPVVIHLSGQGHTRAPCNARSSVFIRMKRRIGWRTWHADTSSMSATLLPGSIAPGSSHLRDAGAVLGMPWIVSTVIKVPTRVLHRDKTLCSRQRAKNILMNETPVWLFRS